MRLLCFGDPHLGRAGAVPDFSRFAPADVDVFVTVGDVADGDGSLERGREFFAALDRLGVLVVTVPGDRDPAPVHADLVDGFDRVVDLHRRAAIATTLPGATNDFGTLAFVGWGCESADQRPEVSYPSYPSLDPDDEACAFVGRHDAADRAADLVETACGDYVGGEKSVADVADAFGVRDAGERERLAGELAALRTTYGALTDVVERVGDPRILVTHVPPFNTAVDAHPDVSVPHWGSIALKLVLLERAPVLTVSGHTHASGYDCLPGDAHVLTLPDRSVVDVDLDVRDRTLSYSVY